MPKKKEGQLRLLMLSTLDPSYAKRLGVDVDNLLIAQPDAGEQALELQIP